MKANGGGGGGVLLLHCDVRGRASFWASHSIIVCTDFVRPRFCTVSDNYCVRPRNYNPVR